MIPDLEKKNVHETYENIAQHFCQTRFAIWPNVKNFLSSLSPSSYVLDIGCGNGKYLSAFPSLHMSGCDRSLKLCDICRAQHFEVSLADNLSLPYRTGAFDAAISIAVIHHFSTIERRLQAILESFRIVRSGGYVLFYIWAFQKSERFAKYPQDALIPWYLPHRYQTSKHKKAGLDMNDHKDIKFERYYHFFSENEFENLINAQSHISILEKGFDKENWWYKCLKN